MINRPAFVLLSIFSLLLSTKLIPREHMPITGWRLSENIVDTRDGVSDDQRDAWLQDILIAGVLSEYFDYHGEEIDLTPESYCYSINKDDEAIVIECPVVAP